MQVPAPQVQSKPPARQIPYDPFVAVTHTAPLEVTETASQVPEPTSTAAPVPTPAWVTRGPDSVEVPILLYHRIGVSPINSRYYVSPDKFEEQMRLLRQWGYHSISMELLVEAIVYGAPLPPRPIVITFDDGNRDTYDTAFPIMREYGYTGVLYIIGKYMGAPFYMDKTEILEMVGSGWEIGSHGMTHQDLLLLEEEGQQYELRESRRFLKDELGVTILSFSYPYGSMDAGLARSVSDAGYLAAVGTISSPTIQDADHLFHMRRKEIDGQQGLDSFSNFLPWQGEED